MIAQIAPLSLLAAVSPATLTAVLLILSGSNPIRLLVALYAGGIIASVGIGYAIVTGLEASGALTGSGSSHVSPIVDLTVGVLALLLAGWLSSGVRARRKQLRAARKAQRPHRDPWSQRVLDRGSMPLIFGIGMVLNLPGGMYLVALKDVAVRHPSNVLVLVALVAFNLIMLAPIGLPLVAASVDPEGTLKRLRRTSAWLGDHGLALVVAVSVIAGVYLVVRGVAGF